MITCTYCGNANSDNRPECQYCGAPLSNAAKRSENGPRFQQSVRPQQPQQSVPPVQPVQPVQSGQVSELPAWLQSLRSDAPTPTSSSEPVHYSAADFIDENDLPRWMQSSNGTEEEKNASQQRPSLRPSSSSSPNTDEGYVRNISAHDLIDEQMLPAWMKSDSGVGGGETSSAGQRNISASGLIQQDSVPDWMRNFPQDQPGPGIGGNGSFGPQVTPSQSPQSLPSSQSSPSYPSFQPQAAQGFASQPLSAHDLIDQQALPPWLREQGFQGNQGSQGSQEAQSAGFQQEGQQGGQPGGQQGSQQSWNASYQGQNSGAKGFSASSLVDMNSLPSWMRNADASAASAASAPSQQGPQSYSTNSAQPTMPSSPSQGQGQGQAMWQNMPQQQQTPSQQGGLSANSFIDVNALPDWLRAASESGQLGGQGVQGGQGGLGGQGYATPPRADNVRVPSRPRGDIGMNEGNEAAANAFASMLGVASHAPQFPQSQQGPQNPSYPASPVSPVFPPSPASPMASSSPQYQNNQNAAFAGPGSPPANTAQAAPQPSYMNNIGVAQMPPMGAQPVGYPTYGQPSSGQNAMPYNQAQGQQGQPYQPMQPMQSMQQHQSHPSSQLNQEKPQKRGGLFEAIRNFFFRQS